MKLSRILAGGGQCSEEMRSIEENGTCHLADLPPGRRSIGLKWVFKVKRDENGDVVKHKA
jgi:hypothetical protein